MGIKRVGNVPDVADLQSVTNNNFVKTKHGN